MSETTTRRGRGWGERGAGLARGGALGAGVVLVALLVAMVNYFGWKYHARLDWTSSRLYTLSEKTENVLKGLQRDVEVVVFLQPSEDLYESVHELLSRYAAASPHIKVRYLDVAKNPLEAKEAVQKYDVQTTSVVFVAGDDRQVVQSSDLATFDYSGMQFGGRPEVKAFKGEQRFTSALVQLADSHRPVVRFTTGHGERKLDDASQAGFGGVKRLLRDDNLEIEEWASMGAAAVPDGTDLVVIARPTSTFLPPELEVLSAYLARGGRLLVLLDPLISRTGSPEVIPVGLEDWLAGWGVKAGLDVVVDPTNPLPFFGAETFFVSNFGVHPTTKSLREEEVAVLVSLARSVGSGQAPAGYKVTELLRTSPEGWGETDLAEPKKDAGDLAGPVPLGVAVEPTAEPGAESAGSEDPEGAAEDPEGDAAADDPAPGKGGEDGAATSAGAEGAKAPDAKPAAAARLVVLGDSDFATDQLLDANVANGVLFSSVVNWLLERNTLIGIPPKEPERVRLTLSGADLRWIYALTLLGLPALGILGGVLVYSRRRR